MLTLSQLYNRYDGRPPKHLLEAALTGKSQIEIAIDTLRRQARWNMVPKALLVRIFHLAGGCMIATRTSMCLLGTNSGNGFSNLHIIITGHQRVKRDGLRLS